MNDIFYSVDDISRMLDLHPKTVRRFIREGDIKGRKFGREWKVLRKDLAEYTHAELAVPADTQPGGSGGGREDSSVAASVTVSAVIEIRGKDSEEASRISNSLMALLNSKDQAWGKTRFDFIYHPEDGRARYIIYGSPAFIAEIMKVFSIIREQRD